MCEFISFISFCLLNQEGCQAQSYTIPLHKVFEPTFCAVTEVRLICTLCPHGHSLSDFPALGAVGENGDISPALRWGKVTVSFLLAWDRDGGAGDLPSPRRSIRATVPFLCRLARGGLRAGPDRWREGRSLQPPAGGRHGQSPRGPSSSRPGQ